MSLASGRAWWRPSRSCSSASTMACCVNKSVPFFSYPINFPFFGGTISGGVYPGSGPGDRLQIALRVTPTSNTCSACVQFRWTQRVSTNSTRSPVEEFLDPYDADDKSPFYETDAYYAQYPNSFYDAPRRVPHPTQMTLWRARLCLVCVRDDGSWTILTCLQYGFSLPPGVNKQPIISPPTRPPGGRVSR